jgi:hypothetical protein
MSQTLTPEQRMNVDEWIGALRSGEYKQGKYDLHALDGSFCGLGVLADVQRVEWLRHSEEDVFYFRDGSNGVVGEWFKSVPTKWFMDRVGLDMSVADRLIQMNDRGASFDDIADEIKRRAYDA